MAPKRRFGKPDKQPDPVLLALIAQFFSNHGFKSSLRIFTTERQKRSRKGVFTDTYGEKHTVGLPQLDVIFRRYQEQNKVKPSSKAVNDESTSGESEAEEADSDVEMADGVDAKSESEDGSSSSSSSSSAESSDESEKEVVQSKANSKTLKRKASSSSSGSSESSSTGSDSSASEKDERPSKKAKVQSAKPESNSESSASSSSSDSESEAESEEPAAKVLLPESDSSSSSSSSEADSESDSDSGSGNEQETASKPNDAESDSSDSSSDDTSVSSEENDVDEEKVAPKVASPIPTTKTTTQPRASSDSSATLQGDPAPLPPWPERKKHTGARPTRLAELSATYDQNDPSYIDNKYVSYDYADRAYKDLSVTRGKGFTKEKNKKKRGSYRGGAIDTSGGKAFKFND